jgi:hypothetical protein
MVMRSTARERHIQHGASDCAVSGGSARQHDRVLRLERHRKLTLFNYVPNGRARCACTY